MLTTWRRLRHTSGILELLLLVPEPVIDVVSTTTTTFTASV
jgi:hypothetical protein